MEGDASADTAILKSRPGVEHHFWTEMVQDREICERSFDDCSVGRSKRAEIDLRQRRRLPRPPTRPQNRTVPSTPQLSAFFYAKKAGARSRKRGRMGVVAVAQTEEEAPFLKESNQS